MDTIIDYIDQMVDIMDNVKGQHNACSKRLSEMDILAQEVLHALEILSFTTEQGYQFAKNLKEIRIRRRSVKNELALLQIVVSCLPHDNFVKVKSKLDS